MAFNSVTGDKPCPLSKDLQGDWMSVPMPESLAERRYKTPGPVQWDCLTICSGGSCLGLEISNAIARIGKPPIILKGNNSGKRRD